MRSRQQGMGRNIIEDFWVEHSVCGISTMTPAALAVTAQREIMEMATTQRSLCHTGVEMCYTGDPKAIVHKLKDRPFVRDY